MPPKRRVSFDPRQLWLGFDDGPPPPSEDSVFFAVMPDPVTAERTAQLSKVQARRHGLPGKPRRTETLHVSLLGLGKYEDLSSRAIDAARRAASTVRAAPFLVAFNRMLSFRKNDKYPLVLCGDEGVVGIFGLHEALHAAMAGAGRKPDAPPGFTPHVTLHYGPKSIPEIFLDEPLSWTVSDFVLVHSFHGESRYEILGRWLLGDAGGGRQALLGSRLQS